MTRGPHVAVWCDTGADAAAWRVGRVLALVDELLMRGAGVLLVDAASGPSWAEPHVRARGLTTVPAPDSPEGQTRLYDDQGIDAVVADTGAVKPDVCSSARRSGRPTVALVDGEEPPDADIVVDPEIGAERTRRRVRGGATVLAGAEYALLGNDVLANRPIAPRGHGPDEVPRVGIVLDGATGWSLAAAQALVRALVATRLPFDAAVVVPGDARFAADDAPRLGEGQRLRAARATTRLYDQAARWHVALTAAGPSTYDWLCLGLPVGLVWRSEDQVDLYRTLMVRRAVVGLGPVAGVEADATSASANVARLLGDPRERSRLAEKGWRLVDGLGRARVVDALLSLLQQP